jgi:hypothetical protein
MLIFSETQNINTRTEAPLDVVKQVLLKVNTTKTKYMSRQQNNIQTADKSFEKAAKFKHMAKIVKNKNYFQGKIERIRGILPLSSKSFIFPSVI